MCVKHVHIPLQYSYPWVWWKPKEDVRHPVGHSTHCSETGSLAEPVVLLSLVPTAPGFQGYASPHMHFCGVLGIKTLVLVLAQWVFWPLSLSSTCPSVRVTVFKCHTDSYALASRMTTRDSFWRLSLSQGILMSKLFRCTKQDKLVFESLKHQWKLS